MKLFWVALISCCLTTFANAKTQKGIVPIPILYTRDVPSFARNMMPQQSKSLFWGKFSLNANVKEDPQVKRQQQLQGNYKPIPKVTPKGFHLYALYAPELKRKQPTSNYLQCHLALDIFTLSPKPKLINRVFLVFKGGWAPTTYGMHFTWMNPKATFTYSKENTIPMIIVKSFFNGIYGPSGIEHFIVFPNGWTNQASIANLQFGGWRASDTAGEINSLVIGWNNRLEIHASLNPATSELSPEQYSRDYTFSLLWDIMSGKYVPHAENQKVIKDYFDPFQ